MQHPTFKVSDADLGGSINTKQSANTTSLQVLGISCLTGSRPSAAWFAVLLSTALVLGGRIQLCSSSHCNPARCAAQILNCTCFFADNIYLCLSKNCFNEVWLISIQLCIFTIHNFISLERIPHLEGHHHDPLQGSSCSITIKAHDL